MHLFPTCIHVLGTGPLLEARCATWRQSGVQGPDRSIQNAATTAAGAFAGASLAWKMADWVMKIDDWGGDGSCER